jgi:hypothetical protein
MTISKYDVAIQIFIETPVFTAAEARAAGIPSRRLAHFCKKGLIERVVSFEFNCLAFILGE